MKILTWNLNGIRATKVTLGKLFEALDADIICLQETKITRDQLDEVSCIVDGYNSYFSFSKVRSGYSGVATFVRTSATPARAEEGLSGLLTTSAGSDYIGCYGDQSEFDDTDLQALDNEGRAVITQHNVRDENGTEDYLTIINVYCPRADPEREDRKSFKLRFYKLLQERAEAILKEGSHVIILGDVNTSHKRIDNCEPGEDFDDHPGRRWLDELLWQPDAPVQPQNDQSFNSSTDSMSLKGHKFVDSFRHFHPDRIGAYTCWCTVTGARATNYGTRIDYIFGDQDLVTRAFTECEILQDFEGSDHCPVKATLKWEFIPAAKCPSLCTKYMPEFVGTQKKLSSFFTKVSKKVSNQLPSSQESEDSGICTSKGDGEEVGGSQACTTDLSESGGYNAELHSSEPYLFQKAFKRTISDTDGQGSKRLKTNDKKASVTKQGSLLNFFGKAQGNNRKTATAAAAKVDIATINNITNGMGDKSQQADLRDGGSFAIADGEKGKKDGSKEGASKKEVASCWKQLLKGPPTAPHCKGHSEPCLLRTVKKEDSLNKGRQFWVCNRPEGHKTNIEARCDTFIWVDKKKK